MTSLIGFLAGGRHAERLAGALGAAGVEVVDVSRFRPGQMDDAVAGLVGGAQLVIAAPSRPMVGELAAAVAPLLAEGALYADASAVAPAVKAGLAERIDADRLVDLGWSLVGAGDSARLHVEVSGAAAEAAAATLAAAGVEAEVVSAKLGDAAARALVRGMLEQGIAAVLIDSLWAAEKLGVAAGTYRDILRDFDAMSAATAKAYLKGGRDVKRRQIEMMDTIEMLAAAGFDSSVMPLIAANDSQLLHSKPIPFADAD